MLLLEAVRSHLPPSLSPALRLLAAIPFIRYSYLLGISISFTRLVFSWAGSLFFSTSCPSAISSASSPSFYMAYNLTIDDTSPQIAYFPATATSSNSSTAAPDLAAGWNQYFNGVGFNTFPGESGLVNESWHITQMDWANFSIAFTGSGIDLYGLALQSTFSIVLDDENVPASSLATSIPLNTTSPNPATALLASISGLSLQDHLLSFTAHTTNADNSSGSGTDTPGFLIFDRAVVSVSSNVSEDAALTTTTISDKDFQFRGSWSFVKNASLIPVGGNTCHITQAAGDQAQYTFKGAAIELSGLTNASTGIINISLTSDSDSSSASRQQQVSGLSSFLIYTTLFYASGLDPNATHTLTVTNVENKTLALSSMNITVMSDGESAPSSSPSSHVATVERFSRGAIAGIAIASSFAALFLIGMLALAVCYRRRQKRCKRGQEVEYSAFGKNQPLHQRIESGDIVPISPRWPGQEPGSPQVELVGQMSPASHLDDAESDSGIGHMQEKRGSVSHLDIATRERERTRKPARHRSFPLARWSGWFTSSTPPSSPRSRRKTPSPPTVPIVSPTPQRAFAPPSVLSPAHLREGSERQNLDLARDSAVLEIPRTSPFEVDFEKRGDLRPSEPSRRPRSLNSGSLSTQAKEMFTSFLDFASSRAASLRESTRTRSRRPSTTRSTRTQSVRERDEQQSQSNQESSGQSQTTSTGLWTLSLSVDAPPRPVRQSQELVPRTAVDTILSNGAGHPFSMVSADLQVASAESPTDSLPMSVSDINFRADEEIESPIVDRSPRFQLPRHPPLPGTPHSYTFRSPTPTTPEFARAGHMRQMSAPNLSLSEPRRPYVAQTSLGRRLAQVRAQAVESQASLPRRAQSPSPSSSEQHTTGQPSANTSRLRLPLPFIHFHRSSSGS